MTASRVAGRRLEILVAVLVVLADQITKAIVRSTIPIYSSVVVIPGVLNFTHVRNSGAAFGILNSVDFPFKATLIAIVATVALVAVAFYAAGLAPQQRAARVGLALVLGGAAGNLLDRILHGSVVDFIDAYWGVYHFWAFNLADSAITIGVAVLILDMLRTTSHASDVL
ncbi:MAG TPA: signal peptidase II [Vicinamibacterales bacterium]